MNEYTYNGFEIVPVDSGYRIRQSEDGYLYEIIHKNAEDAIEWIDFIMSFVEGDDVA